MIFGTIEYIVILIDRFAFQKLCFLIDKKASKKLINWNATLKYSNILKYYFKLSAFCVCYGVVTQYVICFGFDWKIFVCFFMLLGVETIQIGSLSSLVGTESWKWFYTDSREVFYLFVRIIAMVLQRHCNIIAVSK